MTSSVPSGDAGRNLRAAEGNGWHGRVSLGAPGFYDDEDESHDVQGEDNAHVEQAVALGVGVHARHFVVDEDHVRSGGGVAPALAPQHFVGDGEALHLDMRELDPNFLKSRQYFN